MQETEIESLKAYLSQLFSNRELLVVQHPEEDDHALVAIGQSFFGRIERDEDEGELSYSFSKEIPDQPIDEMDRQIKALFNSDQAEVRRRANQTDSAEIYKDGEFLGVLYDDDGVPEGTQIFTMAILDIDLAEIERG